MVGRIITNLNVMAVPDQVKGAGSKAQMSPGTGRVRSGNSLADMVMGFFEEDWHKVDGDIMEEVEDDDREAAGVLEADAEAFWVSQHKNVRAALSLSTSEESRLRRVTEKAVADLHTDIEVAEAAAPKKMVCSCSKGHAAAGTAYCRDCRLLAVAARIHAAGYLDCAVCKSKWRSSPSDRIHTGEHTYLDVVVHRPNSNGKKGPQRLVIEPNFRSEFEMARASEAYSSLVVALPEVFVGKPDRLRSVVKLVCAAAKRSIKDTGMHVAPWRKNKYMLAKWLSPPAMRTVVGAVQQPADLLLVAPPASPMVASEATGEATPRLPRIKTSLLTFDLLEKIPEMRCTALKVA